MALTDKAEHSHENDWAFCQRSLAEVSRTFVRPIEMLPDDLQVAVTCGYLLCRAVDTIEDQPDLDIGYRDELYALFLALLEQDADGTELSARVSELPASGAEKELLVEMPRVMRVFRGLSAKTQQICSRWIVEMTRGMALYSHRAQHGMTALVTVSDLERYCYYVAGTVGYMLTDLFLSSMGELSSESRLLMKRHAEDFGVGLQFVNILKDVTDDSERGWSFIPESVCEAQGLSISELTDGSNVKLAHIAVEPVFARAKQLLDGALEYTLAIPSEHDGIRLFCLLPLWMAARTLVHAKGNDAMFERGKPVKISRSEVQDIIAECIEIGDNDAKLRERYNSLWTDHTFVSLRAVGGTSSGIREVANSTFS